MPRTYGLIDGNAFYCNVEAAFDPRLRNVPLIVLSNNDGCAVARSASYEECQLAPGSMAGLTSVIA